MFSCLKTIPNHLIICSHPTFSHILFFFQGNSLYIQTNPAFSVDNIVLNTPVATFQDEMSIELEIFSNLPREVSISQISLGFSHEASEGSQKRSLSRQPSLYGTVDEPVMNFQTIRPQLPFKINVVSTSDVKQEKLQSSSIICTNTNELLKRADSIPGPVSDSIYKLNYKLSLTAKDVLIKPGVNLVTVKSQVDVSFLISFYMCISKHVVYLW